MATVEPRGLGHSVKRLEDGRFLRGRGNYVDDITLPNMLHMELLRSPVAHALIKSIDTSRAWACGLRSTAPYNMPGSLTSST